MHINNKLIPAVVSIFLLLIALSVFGRPDKGFYTLLRIVLCLSSCFYCCINWAERRYVFFWCFTFTAILFNFLFPIHFDRDVWQTIDVIVLVFFIVFVLLKLIDSKPAKLNIIEKMENDFKTLPKNMQSKITAIAMSVKKIVDYQLEFIPKDILYTSYSKKTINNFVWAYSVKEIIKNKMEDDNKTRNIALWKIIMTIFNENLNIISNFNPQNIIKDSEYKLMWGLIQNMASMPDENQTEILVFLERDYEKRTGRQIRFMEQK
jgi:hypothetical protein